MRHTLGNISRLHSAVNQIQPQSAYLAGLSVALTVFCSISPLILHASLYPDKSQSPCAWVQVGQGGLRGERRGLGPQRSTEADHGGPCASLKLLFGGAEACHRLLRQKDVLVCSNTGWSFPWGVPGGRSGQCRPPFPCNPAAPQNYATPTQEALNFPIHSLSFCSVLRSLKATSLLCSREIPGALRS